SNTLVIVDGPTLSYDFSNLISLVNEGGRTVLDYRSLQGLPALAAAVQVTPGTNFFSPPPVYDWGNSSAFDHINSPLAFTDLASDDGAMLQAGPGALALAGFVSSPA